MNMTLSNQKGDGTSVVVYGITLMLVLVFLAINLLNGKIIENGYNSLRDAVQSATTGSVIHLMTSLDSYKQQETGGTVKEQGKSESSSETRLSYDLYLQLALGYIINRNQTAEEADNQSGDNSVVQSGSVNNFLKLDHKRVVNSTLALLNDSVVRGRKSGEVQFLLDLSDTGRFKILMIFIEPHYDNDNYKKGFDIIVYGNEQGTAAGTIYPVHVTAEGSNAMTEAYQAIENTIYNIVNDEDPIDGGAENAYEIGYTFSINLNDGNQTNEELVRSMETKPYYMIVVKDFALPTLFQDTYTNVKENSNIFRKAFSSLSGDGKLKTPIVALNSAKVERKLEGSRR